MADPFVAEIRITAFNFAPKGWAFCNGQLLPLSQNTALFSLLGTFYGGDGKVTFALPNLQGAAPLHTGGSQPGPGLSSYFLGQEGGSDTVSLLASEMPLHNHDLRADTQDNADVGIPNPSASFAGSIGGTLYQNGPPNVTLAGQAIAIVGGSQPHNNLMPYLTMNYIIALQGVFPPRP
jgi:microcystin-dependent protein